MRKITYFGVFEPSASGYSVYFPDLPGCISCGATFEEAKREAAEALSLHIYGMEQDGDALPSPSLTPEVDPDTTKGYIVADVTVFPDLVKDELDNRRVKTNITIPAWLKDMAEAHRVNYSRLLETALMDYLEIPRHQPQQPEN